MKKVIEAEEKEKPQQGRNKKKPSLVKEKEENFPDLSLHPVSRLAQIQQAAKEREPIYQGLCPLYLKFSSFALWPYFNLDSDTKMLLLIHSLIWY